MSNEAYEVVEVSELHGLRLGLTGGEPLRPRGRVLFRVRVRVGVRVRIRLGLEFGAQCVLRAGGRTCGVAT